ncbi:Glyoxalase/Bleomycin resistance protein/Dihydroxybiphenyl dioxygenase [Xylaria bambusicola]|uniref:Glyoxalase/Bleomycin resistance protein/Dihydroxybiphenyl dioxygenase n=1 Tax=Xylaria bambusicola TaxID=326684 RepID=UPI002007C166|nr:Glyoxalase/Bleomycin resistance protein/Dihydroxybiphenyl dioxygenase [Xylaria bambusicola]KAI0502931.1 Glyoxalase/Bleomycin resistance protein/Dihydroxybiphenyl dioxygenase [Xylaria bambusicola]
MRIPEISNNPSKVQLARMAHVYFEHPDLELFSEFAKDWGFVEAKRDDNKIWYRGYGVDPYVYVVSKSKDGNPRFGGAAFVAKSEEEFEKAALLPGATPSSLADAPGGGKMISFTRSDDTHFHVVYGQIEREAEKSVPSATHEVQGPYNGPFQKLRKGTFQRYREGPALVHKLGHFGVVYRDFDTEINWYTGNFNLVPSNVLYHPVFSNIDVLTFLHLDLGKEFSDHHCMFMQRASPEVKKSYLHHTSYEVADFDEQLIGHEYLAKKGHECVWGVGRHILGSQIFDYWKDPSGFKIEHYADGDLVNGDTPRTREVVGPFSIWGPEVPKDFGDDTAKLITA